MKGVTCTSQKAASQDYLLEIIRRRLDDLIAEHDEDIIAELQLRILLLIETRKHFGLTLWAIRSIRMKISLTDFAHRVGHSDAFQCQIEKGRSLPSHTVTKLIAKELKLPAEVTARTVQSIRDREEAKKHHRMSESQSTENGINALIQEVRPLLDPELKVKHENIADDIESEEETRKRLSSLLLGLSKDLAEGHLPLQLGKEAVSKIERLFSVKGDTRERLTTDRGIASAICHGGNS